MPELKIVDASWRSDVKRCRDGCPGLAGNRSRCADSAALAQNMMTQATVEEYVLYCQSSSNA
jgi:hypothetical protein